MARPQFNTEVLIENIKRRGSIPTSQVLYTDDDFAKIATDEMENNVVPLIMSTREEYFVRSEDFSVTSTSIDIPMDSIGMKLRAVCLVTSTNPLNMVSLPRLSLEQVAGMDFMTNVPCGFYVQNNSIIFYPSNSIPSGQTVRLFYFDRPLALVEPTKYCQVQSVDEGTASVVVDSVPSNFVVGGELNSVSSEPGFQTTNRTTEIISLSAPTIFLTSVEGIEVGDYISEIGTSAVPQLPVEAHGWLAQLSVVKCLEGLGDREGMKAAEMKAEQVKQGLLTMINPRVDGSVKKVVSPSGGIKTFSGSRYRVW